MSLIHFRSFGQGNFLLSVVKGEQNSLVASVTLASQSECSFSDIFETQLKIQYGLIAGLGVSEAP